MGHENSRHTKVWLASYDQSVRYFRLEAYRANFAVDPSLSSGGQCRCFSIVRRPSDEAIRISVARIISRSQLFWAQKRSHHGERDYRIQHGRLAQQACRLSGESSTPQEGRRCTQTVDLDKSTGPKLVPYSRTCDPRPICVHCFNAAVTVCSSCVETAHYQQHQHLGQELFRGHLLHNF